MEVLITCPSDRDRRALKGIEGPTFHMLNAPLNARTPSRDLDLVAYTEACIRYVETHAIDAVFYSRDLAGTVVLVGVPNPEMRIDLPLLDVFGRGGTLKSSWYGDCLPSRDFPMIIDLYMQGRLDLDRFVSETIQLNDVETAFQRMERGEVLRSVVVF